MDSLGLLTTEELQTILIGRKIALPAKEMSSNGTVTKDDLIKLLMNKIVDKETEVAPSIHEILPFEMLIETAHNMPMDRIASFLSVDKKLRDLVNDIAFWRTYLTHHDYGSLLKTLIGVHLTTEGLESNTAHEIFLLLWREDAALGVTKTEKLYKDVFNSFEDHNVTAATEDRMHRKKRGLAHGLWKYAPLFYRSYFHQDVVDALNAFLKRWDIVPTHEGVEDFYFRKIAASALDNANPAPDSDEDSGDTENGEFYGDFDQCLSDIDEEAGKEWNELSNRIIFTGEYYELIRKRYFYVGDGPFITINRADKISRGYTSVYCKMTVGEMLTQASHVLWDPDMSMIDGRGSVDSVEIDINAKYPTLIIRQND